MRAIASHNASRVLSVAQTAASPEALVCQAYCRSPGLSPKRPVMTSSKRSGLADGSSGVTLPKKLSSCVVERAVCESVEPIMPNLNGFAPSFSSYFRPRFSASRAYSRGSMSGV